MRWFAVAALAVVLASSGAFAVTFDGRSIPTDFAGSLKATQTNPTSFGDTWGNGAGSELDQLFVTAGTRNGVSGLYVAITGNLEPKTSPPANAYVILIEAAPGGSNVLTPKPGDPNVPDAVAYLNGTTLDVGFNPTCAITFNNWANTVYVDAVDLIMNQGRYLGSRPVNGGGAMLENSLGSEFAFNNTNTVGVTSNETKTPEQNAADAATAGTGMEAFFCWADLGVNPWEAPSSVKVMVLLDSKTGYMSNQTLPGMGGGQANPGFAGGPPGGPGSMVNYQNIGGNQFVAVDISTPIASTPVLDGAAIPTDFAGHAVATQDNHTGFGDRTGDEGSELDQLFATQTDSGLDIGITGNLENGGNFWLVFLELGPGGSQVLQVPDGVGPMSGVLQAMRGTRFNNGFAPTHVLCMNIYDGSLHVDLTDLKNGINRYIGHAPVNGGSGNLADGDNPNGILVAFDNTNHLGVTGESASGAATATTGAEIHLTWADLGGMSCGVKAMALLTGNVGFVSNQALAPFDVGTPSFGNPPADFSSQTANQFVSIPITLPPYTPSTLEQVRLAPAGSQVTFANVWVSAAFPDEAKYYVQADGSPLAITVYDPVTSPGEGAKVTIEGFVTQVGGARAVAACQTTIVEPPGTRSVKPYAMSTRDVGGTGSAGVPGLTNGSGAPNLGTLVCVCGRVTYGDPYEMYYYLDDGAGLTDGTTHLDFDLNEVPNVGIKVVGPHALFGGEFVRAVGIASKYTTLNSENEPVEHAMIQLRKYEDSETIPEP